MSSRSSPSSSRSRSRSPEDVPSSRKRAHRNLLDCLTQTGKQKKKQKTVDKKAMLPYIKAGRWAVRSIHPFLNITVSFHFGMISAGLNGGDGGEDHNDEDRNNEDRALIAQCDPKQLKIYVNHYNRMLDSVIGFRNGILEFADDISELEPLLAQMVAAFNEARSNDSSSLKHDAMGYIMKDPDTEPLVPPIPRGKFKSDRGFNHPVIARMLCPMARLKELDADPRGFTSKLLDGHVKVVHGDWASFLYEDTSKYNDEAIDEGLMRGEFLVRVYRHIFTGPNSALRKTPGAISNKSNAYIHGLVKVTPETIAYAAMQARFTLSTMENFAAVDGDFNHHAFFDDIMELFEDVEWCNDTLGFFNKQVFSSSTHSPPNTDANTPPVQTAHSRLLEQRKRRAAERERNAAINAT